MRVLLFEPRSEGHHVPWAGMIARSLLDLGATVVLAHGEDPAQLERLESGHPGLLERLQLHPTGNQGRFDGGSALAALARADRTHRPDRVLVANLDEFAAGMLRRAAIGIRPPLNLHGRLRGIYIRPRPLDPEERGFQNGWKRRGYRRLAASGFFEKLGVLDEDLVLPDRNLAHGVRLIWMPDFWTPMQKVDRESARRSLGVPKDRCSLLFFGVPHHRKGLDLAVRAMHSQDPGRAFLLVAGSQRDDPDLRRALLRLTEDGRAVVHDHYFDDAEMAEAFEASDRVLLPYRSHYGSSGVLSLAASRGRPVIASDHHLLGRRVRREALGVVHRDGDAASLAAAIRSSVEASPAQCDAWREGLSEWALRTTPEKFAEAVRRLVE